MRSPGGSEGRGAKGRQTVKKKSLGASCLHISITGTPGSGKSTICRILTAEHGFRVFSTGAMQREIALQHKVSTLKMNQLMARDLRYDHAIDHAVAKLSAERQSETLIFDSRMAWKFAANSFKVFLTVDPLVAAARVVGGRRGQEEVYASMEDAKLRLIERGRLENQRFTEIYGVDNLDYSNYNFVLDATNAAPEELADIIYAKFRAFCGSGGGAHDIMMAPTSLFPLKGVKDIGAGRLSEYREKKLYAPVSIAFFEGYHYITEGHCRVLAAILNGERFIDVKLAGSARHRPRQPEGEPLPDAQAAGLAAARDFEALGNFRYKSYPSRYLEGAACAP